MITISSLPQVGRSYHTKESAIPITPFALAGLLASMIRRDPVEAPFTAPGVRISTLGAYFTVDIFFSAPSLGYSLRGQPRLGALEFLSEAWPDRENGFAESLRPGI